MKILGTWRVQLLFCPLRVKFRSRFASLDKKAEKHIDHVNGIGSLLYNGGVELGDFLNDVVKDQHDILDTRNQSMTKPVSDTPISLPKI